VDSLGISRAINGCLVVFFSVAVVLSFFVKKTRFTLPH